MLHTLLILLTLAFFFGNQQILRYQEIWKWISCWYIISNSFNFFKFLRIVLINVITILMLVKILTVDVVKIKVVWSKGYDLIISVYDVTNKVLSHNSNYVVDVVIWPKFSNSNISMRKVIITSILQWFDQKNHFFQKVVLVQGQ